MTAAVLQQIPEEWAAALGVAAGGVLLGWILLWLSRRQDRKNFVYRRAPVLPVGSLSVHDDAWIRGAVAADAPLACPWFGTACVYYAYEIERRVTHTHTDSKGRTRTTTTWETDCREDDRIPFRVADATAGILVMAEAAEFRDLPGTGTDYETSSRRHSATLLPVGTAVSVLGVKQDDATFAPYQEVPLLVTTRSHDAFLARGEGSERWLRFFGYLLVFAGGTVATIVFHELTRREPSWVLPPLIGVALLAPIWFVSTYNRLVRQNQQAEAAWGQIDVDLGVRNGVIPQIVAVVQGYAGHEHELFERIARLRRARAARDRIGHEKEERAVSKQLLGLVERYPELEADALYMDLHGKLWALEEKIAASRSFYNEVAKEWNDLVQGIPTVLVAKLCGWKPRPFFAK